MQHEYMYELDRSANSKTKLDVRMFVLRPIEGQETLSSSGSVDKRLFTGENKLHVFLDPITNLWRMKFDSGNLPGALKQSFTTFPKLQKAVEEYYKKRGVMIEKVID